MLLRKSAATTRLNLTRARAFDMLVQDRSVKKSPQGIFSIRMRTDHKIRLAQLRRWRVRKTVVGSEARPRMSVKFTGEHIYVQFINDQSGQTIAAVGTRDKVAPKEVRGANAANALLTGKRAAEAAISKGISAVVFDRGSARYHGKVKVLADAAREAGLKF